MPLQRLLDGAVESWAAHHPCYEQVIINPGDAIRFLEEHEPNLVQCYRKLRGVIRTDFLRLVLLYKNGGVSVSEGTWATESIESLLTRTHRKLGLTLGWGVDFKSAEEALKLGYVYSRLVCMRVIAARPGNPLLRRVIEDVRAIVDDNGGEFEGVVGM